MNLEAQARHAARSLRDRSARLDVDGGLAALRRTHRRRRVGRRVGGAAAAVLLGTFAWYLAPGGDVGTTPQPAQPRPSGAFPQLGAAYDVLDRDVSRSGELVALAAFHRDRSAKVLVGEAGADSARVVWAGAAVDPKAPDGVIEWSVDVAWFPHGSDLAFLVLDAHLADLEEHTDRFPVTLMAVRPDGTGLRVLEDDLGSCFCHRRAPVMRWWSDDGDSVRVSVPLRSGERSYTVEVR